MTGCAAVPTYRDGRAAPEGSRGEPLLALEGVWAGYGGEPVLRGVDALVRPGELVALVGPNGSGKSTLLAVASGVLLMQRGSVRLLGRELASTSPLERARALAVVVQSPTLPESFTAADFVLWGRTPYLRFLGQEGPRDLAAARWAMEATETWAYADRRVGEVSGGERQRLAIARALAQETPLLLLDEPTAHLDLRYQVAILGLLGRLLAAGVLRGVLAVLQDLTLASRYADRLVLLHRGTVAAEGPPAVVLRPDLIAEVYGVPVAIVPHEASGTSAVVPIDGLGGGRSASPQRREGE